MKKQYEKHILEKRNITEYLNGIVYTVVLLHILRNIEIISHLSILIPVSAYINKANNRQWINKTTSDID